MQSCRGQGQKDQHTTALDKTCCSHVLRQDKLQPPTLSASGAGAACPMHHGLCQLDNVEKLFWSPWPSVMQTKPSRALIRELMSMSRWWWCYFFHKTEFCRTQGCSDAGSTSASSTGHLWPPTAGGFLQPKPGCVKHHLPGSSASSESQPSTFSMKNGTYSRWQRKSECHNRDSSLFCLELHHKKCQDLRVDVEH